MRARQRGVSLIEVMVSLVVVSVGALSATSLQIISKRNNWEATQRLMATHLASTVAERMRVNNSATALQTYASLGRYTVATPRPVGGGTLFRQFALDCSADGTNCCLDSASACDGPAVAAIELWQLEQVMDGAMEQVEADLAGGLDSPTVCIDAPEPAGRDGFYTVTIAFRGTLAIADNDAVDCGRDARDAGGRKLYGESNEFRRTLTVSAYIAPSVAK